MKRSLACFGALSCAAALGACAPKVNPSSVLMTPPDNRARCHAAITHHTPLVTEWPASEKANLEAVLRSGGVAVEYSGCEMRVISQCNVGGQYRWQRTTPAVDTLEIASQDELYLKLPLGAVSLESALERAGRLAMTTHVAGHMRLESYSAQGIESSDVCARATHILAAVAVGAFTLRNAGHIEGQGKVDVEGIGGTGAHVQRSAAVLRSVGAPERCSDATDDAPHRDCASPIQVFLWPIPGRTPDVGMPGTVVVDFVSGDADTEWVVNVNNKPACTTPCTWWVDPHRPVVLTDREELEGPKKPMFPGQKPNRIHLRGFAGEPIDSGLQVRAHSSRPAKLRAGVTLSAAGGGLTVIGGVFAGLGGDGRTGFLVSGLVTAAVGVGLLAGGIVMIVRSRARAELVPVRSNSPRLTLTPTGLQGHF